MATSRRERPIYPFIQLGPCLRAATQLGKSRGSGDILDRHHDMESGVERVGRECTRKLEAAHKALRRSEQLLPLEVEAAQQLQEVATQLITRLSDPGSVRANPRYRPVPRARRLRQHPDVLPERGELRLLGHRGFNARIERMGEEIMPTRPTGMNWRSEALQRGRFVCKNCKYRGELGHAQQVRDTFLWMHQLQIATLIPQRGASFHEFSHAGAVQILEISKVQ